MYMYILLLFSSYLHIQIHVTANLKYSPMSIRWPRFSLHSHASLATMNEPDPKLDIREASGLSYETV